MSNIGNNSVVSLTPALNRKRYIILIIAAVFNLPTGLGANWALVQPFVKENFGLDSGAANMPYSVFMAFFVIGNILGGQLQNKKGAKFVIIPRSAHAGFCTDICTVDAFSNIRSAWRNRRRYGV